MARRDSVSPELAAAVFARDVEIVKQALRCAVWITANGNHMIAGALEHPHLRAGFTAVCPAVVIDPSQLGKCWGRLRIEHVKAEPRTGKRAEPQMDRLMAICEGHSEPGMKAGYVWATAHRAEQRQYLEAANRATSSS